MSAAAIRVEGLSKRFRIGERREKYGSLRESLTRAVRRSSGPAPEAAEHWALRDVSLEVAPGEVVGVIGPNGAGKSTFLKVLSRITEPSAGYADIRGRVGSLLEVGTGFHAELTGRENTFLSGAILGMKRWEIERKFDEIVAFAGVDQFVDTPVKHYSSGMYLRLAFAVAAYLEPEVLLVDEVLAVGDAVFQRKCLGRMGEVAREGRTVLLVSHNMAAISRLCPRTIVLAGGRLGYFGDTQEAVQYYLSEVGGSEAADLTQRTDRRGSGRARITRVELQGRDGTALGSVPAGSPLSIALHYEAPDLPAVRNPLFEVKLADEFGHRVCTFSTYLTGEVYPDLPPSGVVHCDLPAVPLAPGSYKTTVIMYVNGELCDMVGDASEVSVVDGDFYGSGKAVSRKTYGSLLVAHAWRGAER